MVWLLGLMLALQAAGEPEAPASQRQSRMDEDTIGYVVMNDQRQLFIYYDDRPDAPVGSFPGEPGYRLYLELAPGLEPGGRQRLAKAIAMFERDASGSFLIHRYREAEGAVPEPGTDRIDRGNRDYACYERVLGRITGPGQHYLLLSDWREICACTKQS